VRVSLGGAYVTRGRVSDVRVGTFLLFSLFPKK
jgi:hypothetical protein